MDEKKHAREDAVMFNTRPHDPMQTHGAPSGTEAQAPLPPRFIRMPEVESITGCKKSFLYSLVKRGEFPQSIALSRRVVVWEEAAVREWCSKRASIARVHKQ